MWLLWLFILGKRLFIVYLYFFTYWFSSVFDTKFWPILGFIFMPLTLLWCSAVENWYYGEWGFWKIVVLILAIGIDLGSLGGTQSDYSNNFNEDDDNDNEDDEIE